MGQTKKEICRFIVAGVCAVCTDMFFYYLFSIFISLSLAKSLSFMMGTVTAYFMNKCYTFEQKEKSVKEVAAFMSLYASTLGVNVAINKLCLMFLPVVFSYINSQNNYQLIKLFAFLGATGTSTVLNFVGQKFWVFKKKVDC